jgi:tetratricopeptide (TPR) repeat protein
MSLPDEQLLYLTGIDHTVQFQSAIAQLFDEPEERQTKREAFKAHVAEMIDTLGIEILAEEFSEEGKRKPQEKETALDDQSMRARFETAVAQCNYETVLEQFSKAKGIEHRFCDPDTKEREALGIEVDPKKETESDWRKRERVWLSRIADCKGRRVLFVCGDKHYDDSAQLLEDNGFNVRRGRRYLISDAEFLDLERTSPDNAQIFKFVGLIDRRQGRWDEAIQNLERAVDRDPRNADVISELGQTYHALHRYEEALATFNRALALEPQSINFRTYPPQMALDGEANTAPLRAVVNAIEAEGPSSAAEVALDSSFQLALQERDIVAAARALASIPSEGELYKFFQFPTLGMKVYWLNCDKTRLAHTPLSPLRGLKQRKSFALNPGVWLR